MWFDTSKQKFILSISGWRAALSQNLSSSKDSQQSTTMVQNSFIHSINVDDLTTIYYGIRSYIEAKKSAADASSDKKAIAIGCDSRISGIILMEIAKLVLIEHNCKIDNLGMIAGPAIMAYTKSHADGFIYFTASHNPPEYNGMKLGSGEGKIQGQDDHQAMMNVFYAYTKNYPDIPVPIKNLYHNLANLPQTMGELEYSKNHYDLACSTYCDLVVTSVFRGIEYRHTSSPQEEFKAKLQRYLARHPQFSHIGVLWDPNGGARVWNTDKDILADFGIVSTQINTVVSRYAHDIIPEGESLAHASHELLHLAENESNTLWICAVVCDCDGDRGNTIFIEPSAMPDTPSATNFSSETAQSTAPMPSAKALNPQEVSGLAISIELAWEQYLHKKQGRNVKVAVAVNGPSSLRCDLIAQRYGAFLARGEVGEANVIATGDKLRAEGYVVPLVAEASNGGTIIYPSTVRDPLCTVLSTLKALLWAEELNFEDDFFSLIKSLPPAHTTATEDPLAKFSLPDLPYTAVIAKIIAGFAHSFFLFSELFAQHDVVVKSYRLFNFAGSECIPIDRVSLSPPIKKGGFAVHFYAGEVEAETQSIPIAFVWLRPSGTEPVVRIMADVQGLSNAKMSLALERALIQKWRDYLNSCLS